MARLPRLTIPGMPHHVLHWGNNQQTVFVDAQDYQCFVDLLQPLAQTHQVAVHAYVLMPDHFHLLVTPPTAEGLPQLMQALGNSSGQLPFTLLLGADGAILHSHLGELQTPDIASIFALAEQAAK